MRRLPCDPLHPDPLVLETAARMLADGSLLIAPTDTVYGLIANAGQGAAAARIYALKSRPADKPLPYLVDSLARLGQLGLAPTPEQNAYLALHWPGATTALLARPNREKIGVRLPDCPLILELIALLGRPLCSTSANPSGQPDTCDSRLLDSGLLRGVDALLDAGRFGSGRASTVVDLTVHPFAVLR